jgi:apolipoprotein N-acyltransferase
MFMSPFLGLGVDKLGRRAHVATFGTFWTVPVFGLFVACTMNPDFANMFDPAVMMVFLGLSYSVCASALWPSLPLLVDLHIVGTANGVATAVQMIGIGICNIVVGRLKGKQFDVFTNEFKMRIRAGRA